MYHLINSSGEVIFENSDRLKVQGYARTLSDKSLIIREVANKNTKPINVLLLCGYRRHGKDKFAKDVESGRLFTNPASLWKLSSKTQTSIDSLQVFRDAHLIHIANPLKRRVCHEVLGEFIFDHIEDVKDTNSVTFPRKIRSYLSEEAKRVLFIDPFYYVKKAWADIQTQSLTDTQAGKERGFIICDHRVRQEREFFYDLEDTGKINLTVIRIFRVGAPIPPPEEGLEHDLDDVYDDYDFYAERRWLSEEEYQQTRCGK